MRIFVLGIAAAFFAVPAWGKVNSTFSVQGDTSHFEISGRDEWRYDKRRVQEGKIFVHEVQLYG
ncbi:MAG: hypothetical protein IT289_02260, partial [Oligoflexia bacterium]|nr:hypothetical protein [Oligoflexia bacterium]